MSGKTDEMKGRAAIDQRTAEEPDQPSHNAKNIDEMRGLYFAIAPRAVSTMRKKSLPPACAPVRMLGRAPVSSGTSLPHLWYRDMVKPFPFGSGRGPT